MAQLVKRLTLDLGSSHELTLREFKTHIGLGAEREACLGFSFSFSFSAPPALALSQNK